MITLRRAIVVAVLIAGLLPATATAQSTREMEREAKRLANIANDVARCKLAAAGTAVPGNLAASQPESAAGCGAAGPAAKPTATPVATGKCPVVGRALNKFEIDQINEFAVAKARALARGLPAPVLSTDVANLMAC